MEVSENKTVDGNSVVGNVNSNEGQLKFSNSNGNGNDNDGVGLSVRQTAIYKAALIGRFLLSKVIVLIYAIRRASYQSQPY